MKSVFSRNSIKMRIHLQQRLDTEGGKNHIDYVLPPTLQTCNFYRICPGLYLAENSLFLATATILYVFNISKAKDGNGAEIIPPIEYDGFVRYFAIHILTITI